MRIFLNTRPVLSDVATALAQAAVEYNAGATHLDATDLTTPTFEASFNAGIRRMGDDWNPGMFAVRQARDGLVALGNDPLAQAALVHVNAVIGHINRGWDYIAQTLINLPRPLEPNFARLAFDRLASAGRSIAGVMDAASHAIAALAAPPTR